jgi:hypothetical protein
MTLFGVTVISSQPYMIGPLSVVGGEPQLQVPYGLRLSPPQLWSSQVQTVQFSFTGRVSPVRSDRPFVPLHGQSRGMAGQPAPTLNV